jgi:hypothetical protein
LSAAPLDLPLPLGMNGAPRRVGVELELHGPSPRAAAALLQELSGGRVLQRDPYRFLVEATAFGDVTVELDLRFAHPPAASSPRGPRAWLARAIGFAASRLSQVELIFPPMAPQRLAELDRLVGALAGRAPGIRLDGPHLNPEVASAEPRYLVAHLRAFVRLAARLRAEMGLRAPRRFGTMTDYPAPYRALVEDPGYRPDLPRLVADYLAANPTRYRELDLLPLLTFLAPDKVGPRLWPQKIKPRPVFHWRMPGARPFAGVVADWNRWVGVEQLALSG